MICPGCEADLVESARLAGKARECAACGGVWVLPAVLQEQRATLPPELRPARHRGSRRCPTCDRRLLLLETPRIAIDRCGDCQGVFLDKGELETLRELAAARPSPTKAAPPTGSRVGQVAGGVVEEVAGEAVFSLLGLLIAVLIDS